MDPPAWDRLLCGVPDCSLTFPVANGGGAAGHGGSSNDNVDEDDDDDDEEERQCALCGRRQVPGDFLSDNDTDDDDGDDNKAGAYAGGAADVR